jgi:hypothetical protein
MLDLEEIIYFGQVGNELIFLQNVESIVGVDE